MTRCKPEERTLRLWGAAGEVGWECRLERPVGFPGSSRGVDDISLCHKRSCRANKVRRRFAPWG